MPAATLSNLESVFSSVITVALGLVGVTVLAMIMVGGFKYINAGGDKEAAGKARLTLTYAFLGLTVAVSAWMILNILSTFLGVPLLLNFSICVTTPC